MANGGSAGLAAVHVSAMIDQGRLTTFLEFCRDEERRGQANESWERERLTMIQS